MKSLKTKVVLALDIVSLSVCVVACIYLIVQITASWWGGPTGEVINTFNSSHERPVETVLIYFLCILAVSRVGYILVRYLRSK
jgi:hypothetical protein